MSLATVFDPGRIADGDPQPLYRKLKDMVRRAVDDGRLAETDALPGERDLAESLGISRVTVRKAFAELVREGVLVQRRGSGTFVATRHPRIELALSRLTSFTEDMRQRGLATDARWLGRAIAWPTPKETLALGLAHGEQVCRFHRLRRADGVPLALELASIPRRYLPDPEQVDASLYAALDGLGLRPVRALQRLHAVALAPGEAAMLEVEPGSPALYMERLSYLSDGRAVEFTQSHYRGDRYDFVAELALPVGT